MISTVSLAQDADVIYCDSWMSYGIQPEERKEHFEALMPFQARTHPMRNQIQFDLSIHCILGDIRLWAGVP